MKKDFYVYEHCRASDGTVFYVGMGQKNRAYTKYSRNKHWIHIYKKHGFFVQFVASGLTLEQAYKLEIETIKKHGKKNLANITDGGDGVKNPTQETRNKMSKAKVGIKQTQAHIDARCNSIMASRNRKNTGPSGFRGVTWHKRAKKWQSQMSQNGTNKSLGLYDCSFHAYCARMKYKGVMAS